MEEMKTALVVADVYRLSKIGSKFNPDTKFGQMKNENHLITRIYANEMNDNWKSTGLTCVIDEEASIEAQEAREAQAVTRLENDKAKETAARAVASMALGANKANPVKDDTPEVNEELEAARKECLELTGEKPHHLKSLKGIRKVIKEYKENN